MRPPRPVGWAAAGAAGAAEDGQIGNASADLKKEQSSTWTWGTWRRPRWQRRPRECDRLFLNKSGIR